MTGLPRGSHMVFHAASHSAFLLQEQDLWNSLRLENESPRVQSQELDTCLSCCNLKLDSGPRRMVDVARFDG